MKHLVLAVMCATILCITFACKSAHEEGVTSSILSQWTDVNADPKAATEAANAVLMEEGLKDVKYSSTSYDGKATGKMADGTKVTVTVKREPKAEMSQVSVNVGAMGSPSLGANLAKKIKERAEGGTSGAMGMKSTTMP
jgi:hypothetical protein